jgi:hypothetical protein
MNTTPPLSEVQPKKSLIKRILIVIFIIIVITIGILWISQGASQGIITQSVPVTDNQFVPSQEKIRLDGKYVSFAYTATYTLTENTDTSAKDIKKQSENLLQSSFLVIYSATSSRKLAVSVERLSDNNLTSNTSFAFRAMNPRSYIQSKTDINSEQATLFIKNDSLHEVALFMKHGDKEVSIVLSSPSESVDAMRDESIVIAKSIEWKN